ncbi:uncharacterized protein LOC119839812 [Zerene cesonia]|uniref:uncharacterized protein LOC119839812 n=1 Tax=Zerene cesonia TaxID=33412 RepID=UPI0018E5A0F6|nr:uncharacterized protein LOC119839812 [Zerene cesonia]
MEVNGNMMSLQTDTAIMSTQKTDVSRKPSYYDSKPKAMPRRSLRIKSSFTNSENETRIRCKHVPPPPKCPYPLYPTLNKIRQHFYSSQQCHQLHYFQSFSQVPLKHRPAIFNLDSSKSTTYRVLKTTSNIAVVKKIASEVLNNSNDTKSAEKPNKELDRKAANIKIGKVEKLSTHAKKCNEVRQNRNEKIDVKNSQPHDIHKEAKDDHKKPVSVDAKKSVNVLNAGYSPPILPIPTYQEALDMWKFPTAAYLQYVYAYSKLME